MLAPFGLSDQQARLPLGSESNQSAIGSDGDSEAAIVGVTVALGFRHLVRVHDFGIAGRGVGGKVVKLNSPRFPTWQNSTFSFTSKSVSQVGFSVNGFRPRLRLRVIRLFFSFPCVMCQVTKTSCVSCVTPSLRGVTLTQLLSPQSHFMCHLTQAPDTTCVEGCFLG